MFSCLASRVTSKVIVPLSESISQAEKSGILHITQLCICHLIRDHILTEGLFRLPGATPEIKALKAQIDQGLEINLDSEVVHNIASLYKLYFMELSSSLLPEQFYHKFRQCAQEGDDQKKLESTRKLFDQIAEDNKIVFIDLANLLAEIAKHSVKNFMDFKNLAICFAPTVILPKSLSDDPSSLMEAPTITSHLAWIVEHIDEIFPKQTGPITLGLDPIVIPMDKSVDDPSPVDSPLPIKKIREDIEQLTDSSQKSDRDEIYDIQKELPHRISEPVLSSLDFFESQRDIKKSVESEHHFPSIVEEDSAKASRKKSRNQKHKMMVTKTESTSSSDIKHKGTEEITPNLLPLTDRHKSNSRKILKTNFIRHSPSKARKSSEDLVADLENQKEDEEKEPEEDKETESESKELTFPPPPGPIPPPPPPIPLKKKTYRFGPVNRATTFASPPKADFRHTKKKKLLGKKKESKIELKEAKEQLEKIISQLDDTDLKLFCEHMQNLAKEELKELTQ